MKTNSILESNNTEPETAPASALLRFPNEDDGRSLTNMAQRDLDAALQLLAQRAQYITAASGAAVALREEGGMICRASAGTSAPGLGSHLQTDSGLSGESVRTRQILRCDNAETDSRVNRETCQALGIASVIVMPLIQNDEVIGVFELFSDRVSAFEERDVVALQRISEMIMTAVGHANAAKRTELDLRNTSGVEEAGTKADAPSVEATTKVEEAVSESAEKAGLETDVAVPIAATTNSGQKVAHSEAFEDDEPGFATVSIELGKISNCASCGFPVSKGRSLCLDCEANQEGTTAAAGSADFLSNFGQSDKNWLASHKYLAVVAILVVILLLSLLRFR
jgi:transcriptional regulator with GAF, ATPase, and Fis domain